VDISAVGAAAIGGSTVKTGKIADAAGQFEALLIGQMLKSMREEGSGWLGTGEDKSADAVMGFAEEQFAAALSAGGGLGLAKMVGAGLEAGSKAPGASGGVEGVGAGKHGSGNGG
jgi:Rod binding domain-containing protein